jgi:hypothetical protein
VLEQLKFKVEGKCTGRYGYTIAVTHMVNVGRGQLHEDSGYAYFPVKYMSLVFRPFKNEILPAKVTMISPVRSFCLSLAPTIDPSVARLHAACLQTGLWVHAGPMEIFVSKHVSPFSLRWPRPAHS